MSSNWKNQVHCKGVLFASWKLDDDYQKSMWCHQVVVSCCFFLRKLLCFILLEDHDFTCVKPPKWSQICQMLKMSDRQHQAKFVKKKSPAFRRCLASDLQASNQNRRVVSVWPFPTWSVKRGGEVPLIWYGKTPTISNLLEKNCTWITSSSQVCCIVAFSKRPNSKRAVRYQIFGSSTRALYVNRQGWNWSFAICLGSDVTEPEIPDTVFEILNLNA